MKELLSKKIKSNIKKTYKKQFKLKKKWRHWRTFKQYFINLKKITFFKKLQWSFNNIRIIRHQLIKTYLPNKHKTFFNYTKKLGHSKFFFFLHKLELRLGILLIRARLFYKIINCYNAIKLNLILVNGIIINKINFFLQPLDLIIKRKSFNKQIKKKRLIRLKWRKAHWKHARFIFWKIRRTSNLNMYRVRKENTILNYLEINYKIPGFVLLRKPFIKELLLKKEPKILTNIILKKIFFLY